MRKISTLLYFVKNFQADFDNYENAVTGDFFKQESINGNINEIVPPERIVDHILDFARSYEVLETKTAGYAEMNLN